MQSITLSELALSIKTTLSGNLAPSYWVTAEVGDMKVNAKGHCYLELLEKDHDQVKAKLRAAIWAYDFRNINQWFEKITGNSLREGIKILANAQVTFHEVYGLNLTIKDIDPNFTIGERERKKQEIIAQLEASQLMNRNKELKLPLVAQRIAVVSSATAAGYGDFLHHLENNRKHYSIFTTLFPASLQGNEAPLSLVKALSDIAEKKGEFDAVAIIRGGGGQLDLDAFNDFEVCAAIASCPLPVLTGIGHERDETIADMVAHTRLKTPTAVADFIMEGFHAYAESIHWLAARMLQRVDEEMTSQKHLLSQLSKDIHYLIKQQMNQQFAGLRETKKDLEKASRWSLERSRLKLREVVAAVLSQSAEVLTNQTNLLRMLEKTVEGNDPKKLLVKGYTITMANGQLLSRTKVARGTKLITIFSGGTINSEVSS